jgi:hypothetical protein
VDAKKGLGLPNPILPKQTLQSLRGFVQTSKVRVTLWNMQDLQTHPNSSGLEVSSFSETKQDGSSRRSPSRQAATQAVF